MDQMKEDRSSNQLLVSDRDKGSDSSSVSSREMEIRLRIEEICEGGSAPPLSSSIGGKPFNVMVSQFWDFEKARGARERSRVEKKGKRVAKLRGTKLVEIDPDHLKDQTCKGSFEPRRTLKC